MSARDIARTVGRYEILDELGRGGMATVYLARQTDLDRSVALKELSAFRQSDPAFAHRFLRESRLAGSLTHPNIVTVHDYFENDGIPYIAMEYVPGGSLRPHIGHMALTQIAGVLEGILSALDHAEQHDIVHRDLKPENVMLTSAGRVKIADFGIAKATGKAQTGSFFTATGTTVGTPNYMAPEQAMGQEVGPWTDLYSVGIMAFEFFVGQVPFHDTEEPMAVLMRQVSDPIPPASSLNPEVDEAVSDWIEGLLEKDPAERTRSAGHAWEELEEIVIAMAGPRWRRTARLVAPSRRPADAPAGPLTPPPSDAARPPLMPTHDVPDWPPTGQRTGGRRRTTGSEARTRRLREGEAAALAATVMPEAPTRRLGHGDAPTLEAPGAGADVASRAWPRWRWCCSRVLVALAAAFGGRDSQNRRRHGGRPHRRGKQRDLTIGVPRGWSRLRSSPDLGLPLSRPVAVAQDGRGGGPVVEFGMARGATAANSTLLPQSLLTAIGNSGGAPPARTAVRLPTQGLRGLALPPSAPRGHPGRADRLRRADLRRRRHAGLRGAARAGRGVRGPMRVDRRDPSTQEGDPLSDRPERLVRERPERGDRRTAADHPFAGGESRDGKHPRRSGHGCSGARARLRDRGRAARRARSEPGRQERERTPGRRPHGRRERLSDGGARGRRR